MKPADAYLLAALDLLDLGHVTFGLPDLAVAVWKRCPERFGIPGYRQYPDKHRVASDLARFRPDSPLGSGAFEKAGRGRYRLTEAGREDADILTDQLARAAAKKGVA
jgi:hypothetical protein